MITIMVGIIFSLLIVALSVAIPVAYTIGVVYYMPPHNHESLFRDRRSSERGITYLCSCTWRSIFLPYYLAKELGIDIGTVVSRFTNGMYWLFTTDEEPDPNDTDDGTIGVVTQGYLSTDTSPGVKVQTSGTGVGRSYQAATQQQKVPQEDFDVTVVPDSTNGLVGVDESDGVEIKIGKELAADIAMNIITDIRTEDQT